MCSSLFIELDILTGIDCTKTGQVHGSLDIQIDTRDRKKDLLRINSKLQNVQGLNKVVSMAGFYSVTKM